jgi:type IV pilus assembly protein PilM
VEGLMVYYRSLAFGCSAFYDTSSFNDDLLGLDHINVESDDNLYEYLVKDILAEVSRSAEYYTMQNGQDRIEKILICGGGSRLKGLDQRLADYTGYPVILADPLTNIVEGRGPGG